MLFTRSLYLTLACTGLIFAFGCSTVTEMPEDIWSLRKVGPFAALTDLLTTSDEEKALRAARAEGLSLTDPARLADLEKIYSKVPNSTRATKYSDNRVKIHSDGALIGSNDRSELDFFIRAAAETLNAGYDGFVVVHLDYFKPGPQLLALTPNMNFSSDRWVGTYEGFLRHRNEQNMFETRSGMNRKVRQGVILMVKDHQFPNRDRFYASDIYLNLIETRYGL